MEPSVVSIANFVLVYYNNVRPVRRRMVLQEQEAFEGHSEPFRSILSTVVNSTLMCQRKTESKNFFSRVLESQTVLLPQGRKNVSSGNSESSLN